MDESIHNYARKQLCFYELPEEWWFCQHTRKIVVVDNPPWFLLFFKFVLKTCFYKLHLSELDNTIFSIIIYVQWYCKICYYFTVPCKFSLWVFQKDSFLQLGGASLSYGPLKIFYVSTALILYNARYVLQAYEKIIIIIATIFAIMYEI